MCSVPAGLTEMKGCNFWLKMHQSCGTKMEHCTENQTVETREDHRDREDHRRELEVSQNYYACRTLYSSQLLLLSSLDGITTVLLTFGLKKKFLPCAETVSLTLLINIWNWQRNEKEKLNPSFLAHFRLHFRPCSFQSPCRWVPAAWCPPPFFYLQQSSALCVHCFPHTHWLCMASVSLPATVITADERVWVCVCGCLPGCIFQQVCVYECI